MAGKRSRVQAAALALIQAAKAGDELCIVDFNDEVDVDTDMTTDFHAAIDALNRVDARGGSALRDAIQMSVDLMKQKSHNRKVLVVITDGDDTSSSATEKQVRDEITSSGVLVYAIALHAEQDSGKASAAKRTLAQLATLTGGAYYSGASGEFDSIASQIERDARKK
jgi:VWFA-related protein